MLVVLDHHSEVAATTLWCGLSGTERGDARRAQRRRIRLRERTCPAMLFNAPPRHESQKLPRFTPCSKYRPPMLEFLTEGCGDRSQTEMRPRFSSLLPGGSSNRYRAVPASKRPFSCVFATWLAGCCGPEPAMKSSSGIGPAAPEPGRQPVFPSSPVLPRLAPRRGRRCCHPRAVPGGRGPGVRPPAGQSITMGVRPGCFTRCSWFSSRWSIARTNAGTCSWLRTVVARSAVFSRRIIRSR
jgi:hypothetical protein